MRFNYGQKRITTYRASNIERKIRGVDTLPKELKTSIIECKSKSPKYRQYLAQRFIDIICGKIGIQSVEVKVYDKPRPSKEDKNGNNTQLYGQYIFSNRCKPLYIELWNRSAVRGGRISNGSFLETLEHELIHHYDIAFLKFKTTPHTKGFFSRLRHLDKMLTKNT